MTRRSDLQDRRTFLTNSLATLSALGAGTLMGGRLFAEPTELAARISEAPESHPLIPALRMGQDALKSLDSVKDYSARFIKRELIGRNTIETHMDLKLREEPFSVYLKFVKPHAGREVLYVKGQNDGNLLVHDVGLAGLAGTIALDPDGSYALAENRYPVYKIGMRTLVSELMEQWFSEIDATGVTVNYYPNARVGTTSCKAIETSYRQKNGPAKFQTIRLYIDSETGYPVRLQSYDFPGRRDKDAPLIEDYIYSDISTNIGLTDADFSTQNSKYAF